MPSDVFWTGLFTFGGATVGAVGGYLGIRAQRDLQESQLELETSKYESEEARRALEDGEKVKEARRLLYLRYLNAANALLHAPANSELGLDACMDLWRDLVTVRVELDVGASDAVLAVIPPLHAALQNISRKYQDVILSSGKTWPNDALSWIREEELAYEPTLDKVVAAMKVDV